MFEMEISKTIDTLIATATRLDIDKPGFPMNETMYRDIIGSLLYLTTSRTDIVFSVGLYTRFQSRPKKSHLKVAKRILRYLKGTHDLVFYHLLEENFDVIGYVDADYTGYLVDRKSTFGNASLASTDSTLLEDLSEKEATENLLLIAAEGSLVGEYESECWGSGGRKRGWG
ncbi:secreted RxLR effector protein 161-like [Nicotiana tabacum]|uniref:Secreted RxLR effector protein 161-like n=1 Tax=Nicotiana tabacum TaxID=4097 RepID=A0AC58T542_TOBAC